jgi:integrator complex subunit 9
MKCYFKSSRNGAGDEDENVQILCKNDDIAEEIERISFICSCIIDATKSGGSVLVPTGRLGVILLILELISETLHSSDMKVIVVIDPCNRIADSLLKTMLTYICTVHA